MLVRLAYSIAIQIPFDVLLLDEVLAVGDEAFQEKCFATFERFKDEGKTVVFVSHALDLVERFCDRCLLLRNGVVEVFGSPQEAIDLYHERVAVALNAVGGTRRTAACARRFSPGSRGRFSEDTKTTPKPMIEIGGLPSQPDCRLR